VDKPKIFINPKSGSIRITGEVEMVDADGNVLETLENPKFCGCGQSKENPSATDRTRVFLKRITN
jgi:hypothetical protein